MSLAEEYQKRAGKGPNSLVLHALDFVLERSASLDLGAGNLRDSRFLLKQGFERVVAVDGSETSRKFASAGIELHIARIEEWEPELRAYDFAFSCNTLFFLSHAQVAKVFQSVSKSLRSGGIFACNVLGEKDGWVLRGERVSYYTEETLLALCADFELIGTGESKILGSSLATRTTPRVPKFWHQRNPIVRKP